MPTETFQDRVRDEKMELDLKLRRLGQFIEQNPFFQDLDEIDQRLLRNQRMRMLDYSVILGQRIARFSKEN